jgi:hypothetical protein
VVGPRILEMSDAILVSKRYLVGDAIHKTRPDVSQPSALIPATFEKFVLGAMVRCVAIDQPETIS